jgi:hypothetical protein
VLETSAVLTNAVTDDAGGVVLAALSVPPPPQAVKLSMLPLIAATERYARAVFIMIYLLQFYGWEVLRLRNP